MDIRFKPSEAHLSGRGGIQSAGERGSGSEKSRWFNNGLQIQTMKGQSLKQPAKLNLMSRTTGQMGNPR
jgi:hypothetical protein